MNNQFYIPTEDWLKQMIVSFWQVEGECAYKRETIIPSGITEIIFNFSAGNLIQASIGNNEYNIKRCVINGFNTSNILLHLPEKQSFFGVRFQPAALKNIFGVPAGEFANETVDLTLIDSTFTCLWHLLAEQKDFYNRVDVTCGWVKRRGFSIDPKDLFLSNFLSSVNTLLTVKQLSALVNYSPRHLSRKFFALTGMNTVETLLYKKYLNSVNLIHTSNSSLTDIGYDCGFSDQSHFIKTFKTYTGITPGGYRKIKSPLAGHILSDVR